jgi:hypothetical protein
MSEDNTAKPAKTVRWQAVSSSIQQVNKGWTETADAAIRPGLFAKPFGKISTKNNVISISYGEWCNGSTTDSDSVCLGSNPSSPANSIIPHHFKHLCAGQRGAVSQHFVVLLRGVIPRTFGTSRCARHGTFSTTEGAFLERGSKATIPVSSQQEYPSNGKNPRL